MKGVKVKAVLHYENRVAEAPGGIWWLGQNENVLSYYTDQNLRVLGENRFMSLKPDVDYSEYFDYLDGKMPYEDTWALAEVPEGMSPKEYLAQVQSGEL
jgi:hypothetical protein